MNNFRGFSNTTIPLQQVNFFVGENSTGKTSLLALLDLLSKPQFWFNLDFNAGDYEFGGFKDIVSINSLDQSEFQIGLCKHDADITENNACYLLHFRQSKDGLPELIRFSQLCPEYYATIRITEKQIAANMRMEKYNCNSWEKPNECFEFLSQIPLNIKNGYRVLPGKTDRYIRAIPIANFPSILDILFKANEINTNFGNYPFPSLNMSFAGMAPIRTTPKRTYDGYTKTFNPQGEHTPYVIRKKLTNSPKANQFKQALESFGRDSGLFESIGVTQFGKDSAAPFELTITLNTKALRINSVGYGVSQVLPIVVELLVHGNNSWLGIQQPEVHLHPRAQASLGEILYLAATEASQTLFIETHSDYMIDRFRTKLRESKKNKPTTQVIYFERTEMGNQAYAMNLDIDGEYPTDQPTGFRDFFLKEQRRILGV